MPSRALTMILAVTMIFLVTLTACSSSATSAPSSEEAPAPPAEEAEGTPWPTPAPLPTSTTSPPVQQEPADPSTWQSYHSAALALTLQHPATWELYENEGTIHLMSPERFGEGAEEISYVVYLKDYPNPEGRSFEEVVTAEMDESLRGLFEYSERQIGSRTVFQTTSRPSRSGELALFFDRGDRYTAVVLAPYDTTSPLLGQEQSEALFNTLVERLQFDEG